MTTLAQTARQNRAAALTEIAKRRATNLVRIDFATVSRLGNKAAALSGAPAKPDAPDMGSDLGMRQVIRPALLMVAQSALPLAA